MGRSPRSWRVPDRVYESLVTGFRARVGVVDGTLVFHVIDPAVARFQNGRKPGAVRSVTVSATVLKPRPATFGL